MHRSCVRAAALVVASLCALPVSASESEYETVAEDVALLFRSARSVISSNQARINEKGRGAKGLTADHVVEATLEVYREHSRGGRPGGRSALGQKLAKELLASVRDVMTKVQPLIDRPDLGFKGFLPAVFAKQVADEFSRRTHGAATIKLTAPAELVRNRANRPDSWERQILDEHFRSSGWPRGQSFFARANVDGAPGFRLMIPEYYQESCLGCHGEPAGAPDITGGRKEGGTLGQLAGAISVVIREGARHAGR